MEKPGMHTIVCINSIGLLGILQTYRKEEKQL